MFESARKHGPFDERYPARQKLPAPRWDLGLVGEGEERLEWSAFPGAVLPEPTPARLRGPRRLQGLHEHARATNPGSSDRRCTGRLGVAVMMGLTAVRRPRRRVPAGRSLRLSRGAGVESEGGAPAERLAGMSAEFSSHRGLLSYPPGSASAAAGNSSEAKVEPKPRAAGPPIPPVAGRCLGIR
jgi:hypothetical protein